MQALTENDLLIALISGECDLSMQTLVSTGGYITSGRLRALAVTSKKRLDAIPNVPTVAESGVPGYEFNTWVGVLAPAATPPAFRCAWYCRYGRTCQNTG